MRRVLAWWVLAAWIAGCEQEGAESPPPDAAVAQDARADVPSPRADGGCLEQPEVCNGRDDDCDGLIDAEDPDLQLALLDDPQNCGTCGVVCAAPRAELDCQAGACVIVACEPGFTDFNADLDDGCEADCVVTAGGTELCDAIDNDCDGRVDEGHDLDRDVLNCGACGRVCAPAPHARVVCDAGECMFDGCERGYADLDGPDNGCEYACTPRSTEEVREYCNGLDDDCDGRVDEHPDITPPDDNCGDTGACAPECAGDVDCPAGDACTAGICVPAADVGEVACEADADCHAVHPGLACVAQVTLVDHAPVTTRRCVPRTHGPLCDGADGFRCARGPSWQHGDERGRCDGLDNDCDGRIDEDYVADLYLPDRVTPAQCHVGLGVCLRSGQVVCRADGGGTRCSVSAGEPAAAADDDCDGLDDDCDGLVDEDFADAVVRVGDVEIYAYEASRPGATALVPGLDPRPDDAITAYVEARACSRPEVLPWADVTWHEAEAACAAAGARLCTGAEWALACGGPGGEPYPYGPRFQAGLCNDGYFDPDPVAPGDQDAVLPTGRRPACGRDGVFDLSGNLKEWTADRVRGLRPVRGGGFETNLASGLACGLEDDLKTADFRHPGIGFRCCR